MNKSSLLNIIFTSNRKSIITTFIPMKTESAKHNANIGLVIINIASLFIATAGIFAKHMSLYPPFITFARCLIASIILFCIISIRQRQLIRFPFRNRTVLLSGVLMTVHWVSFFYSIAYSSVAIAAISVFTFPIFTAILEPILLKKKLDPIHIFIALVLLVGIYIISPEISLSNDVFLGVLFGLLSAAAYAVRNIYSKDLGKEYDSVSIMFFQVTIVAVLLLPFSGHHDLNTIYTNLLPLIGLGILPTIIGHGLLVESFKYFSATKASILTSFQPIIAIVMGMVFLNEYPTPNVWLGGAIITIVVVYEILRPRSSN